MPNQRQHGDRFSAASQLQIGTCAERYAYKNIPLKMGLR